MNNSRSGGGEPLFAGLMSPRNIRMLTISSNSSVMKVFARLLEALLRKKLLSIGAFSDQCVALFRQDWPEVIFSKFRNVPFKWLIRRKNLRTTINAIFSLPTANLETIVTVPKRCRNGLQMLGWGSTSNEIFVGLDSDHVWSNGNLWLNGYPINRTSWKDLTTKVNKKKRTNLASTETIDFYLLNIFFNLEKQSIECIK